MIKILALVFSLFSTAAFAGWSPMGPYGGVITSVAVSKEGIYAGTEGGGVFFSSDGGKKWEGRGKGLENIFIESLAVANEGTVYAGTRDGIFKSRDGRAWEILQSVPRGSAVKSIAFDSEGNLYASLWGSGVFICQRDADCTNPRKELSSLFVNKIMPMDNGDVILATEGGIFRKPKGGDKWMLDGLIEYIVPSIAMDGQNILYAGTWGGGINYFENNDWHFRSMGVASSMVATLVKGPDNNLYAGTEGGVSVLPKGSSNWSTVGLEKTYVKALGFGSNGEIFAGSYGRGFFAMEKGKDWEDRNAGIYNSNIISIAFSDKGEVYAGTKQGLYISAKGDDNWVEVPELYGMKVNAFLMDGGRVYAGTSNGLFVGSVSEKVWKRVDGDAGYMPVTSLARVDSLIYAGTDSDGVFRGEPGKGSFKPMNEGLENPRIRSLISVDNANVYAGTYEGIYTLQKGMDKWMKAGLQDSVIVSLTSNGGALFAAAENKGVYTFTNGRWASVDGSLPSKRILSVFHSGKTLYASGYGWVVAREGDGPWNNLAGELSNSVIQAVAADRSGKVYAGTWGSGIWRMK